MGAPPQAEQPQKRVKMVDLRHGSNIINQPTAVHCEKHVKCWPGIRTLAALVTPSCCGCTKRSDRSTGGSGGGGAAESAAAAAATAGSIVTGTIFGQRKGKVSICIQDDPRGAPVLLLELAMPTFLLVKEMSSGLLRIALECELGDESIRKPLYSEPVWTMLCNGRKVGFAVRRACSESDRRVLGLTQSVSMGAGVIPLKPGETEEDELMYMRATYERVVGSPDSQSFHMINPDGSPGQELSIFLMRA